MAVYDEKLKMLDNSKIIGVIALFSTLEENISSCYIRNWCRYGLNSKIIRLPVVKGINLSILSKEEMYENLDKIINIACKPIYSHIQEYGHTSDKTIDFSSLDRLEIEDSLIK